MSYKTSISHQPQLFVLSPLSTWLTEVPAGMKGCCALYRENLPAARPRATLPSSPLWGSSTAENLVKFGTTRLMQLEVSWRRGARVVLEELLSGLLTTPADTVSARRWEAPSPPARQVPGTTIRASPWLDLGLHSLFASFALTVTASMTRGGGRQVFVAHDVKIYCKIYELKKRFRTHFVDGKKLQDKYW